MNKKDKDNMIILGFLVSFIVLFFFFNFITKKIYFIVLAGGLIALQTFLIIPNICKLYYEVNDLEHNFTRFIPFYQELTIFPETIAKVLAVTWMITVILFSIITLGTKSGFLGSVLSLEFIIKIEEAFGDVLANILAIVIILSNILTGIGFTRVRKDVVRMDTEFSGVYQRNSVAEFVQYLILYLPVFRCISLANIWNTLLKLTRINKYRHFNEDTELLEEE